MLSSLVGGLLGALQGLCGVPLCQRLGAELRDLRRRGQDLTREDERVEPAGRRDGLEDLVHVLVGQGLLALLEARAVLELPLLQPAGLVLERS